MGRGAFRTVTVGPGSGSGNVGLRAIRAQGSSVWVGSWVDRLCLHPDCSFFSNTFFFFSLSLSLSTDKGQIPGIVCRM